MSTEHTPGPWVAELDAHGRGRIKGDGCWVATTWTTADDDSNKRYPAEANARLIAAAPDLLEALKAMVESVTGVDQVSVVNEARAVILKARIT